MSARVRLHRVKVELGGYVQNLGWWVLGIGQRLETGEREAILDDAFQAGYQHGYHRGQREHAQH